MLFGRTRLNNLFTFLRWIIYWLTGGGPVTKNFENAIKLCTNEDPSSETHAEQYHLIPTNHPFASETDGTSTVNTTLTTSFNEQTNFYLLHILCYSETYKIDTVK